MSEFPPFAPKAYAAHLADNELDALRTTIAELQKTHERDAIDMQDAINALNLAKSRTQAILQMVVQIKGFLDRMAATLGAFDNAVRADRAVPLAARLEGIKLLKAYRDFERDYERLLQ